MKRRKKLIYTLLILLLMLFMAFAVFYIGMVNIYQPLIIKVKINGNYTTDGITVKGQRPLRGLVKLTPDVPAACWRIKKAYYRYLLITCNELNKKISTDTVGVEIYSAVDTALLKTHNFVPWNDGAAVIGEVGEKKLVPLLIKVLFPVRDYLLSIAFLLLLIWIVFRIKNQSFFPLLIKLFFVLIILWSYSWLILASFYTYPNAEDLSLVLRSKNSGIINAAVHFLITYDGRYFTNILHGVNPLIWGGVDCYKWMPVISLIAISLSVYFFITTLFSPWIKRGTAVLLSGFVVVYHFYSIPSIVHDLYWMSSSFVYLWSWILFFLWTSFFIRFFRTKNNLFRVLLFVVSSILLICSYGTNEMMLIVNTFILFIFSVYIFKNLNERKNDLWAFYLLAAASIYLFISSPGIHYRYDSLGSAKGASFYLYAWIKGSGHFLITLFDYLFHKSLTIPAMITSYVILKKYGSESVLFKFSPKQLLALVIMVFGLMYILPFIYYFAMGTQIYPKRVYNFINWIFILEFLLLIPALLIRYNVYHSLVSQKVQQRVSLVLVVFAMFHIVFTGNNVSDIQREYSSGLYSAYQKEMQNRYRVIENAKQKKEWQCAVVDTLKVKPSTIYFPPDISSNRKCRYWNQAYEGFFKIDEIMFKGDTLTKGKIIRYEAGL